MMIRYYLRNGNRDSATIVVADSAGTEVGRLRGSGAAGINSVLWSTRRAGAADGRGGRGGSGTVLDQLMPLGRYTVTLEIGDTKQSQPAQIIRTQGWSAVPASRTIRDTR